MPLPKIKRIKSNQFILTILSPTVAVPFFQWFVGYDSRIIGQGQELKHPQAKREGAAYRLDQIRKARALAAENTRKK